MMMAIIGDGGSRLVYNGKVTSAITSNVITFTSVPLGDAQPSRVVYIAFGTGAAIAPTGFTLGGTGMTVAASGPASALGLSVYSLALASGTSATVVATFSGATGGGFSVFSYSAYSQPSTTVFATNAVRVTSSATVDVSLNTSSNGFVIGVSAAFNASATAFTGLTSDDSATPVAGQFTLRAASAQNVIAATPRSITATATGATNNQATTLSMP